MKQAISWLLVLALAITCAVVSSTVLGCWIAGGYIADFSGTCLGVGLIWKRF